MRSGYSIDAETNSAGDVDLSRIARVLNQKRWWVLGPTLAALIGAIVFVNVVKPRYSAEARLLLENQESFLTRVDKGERADPTAPDAEAVQSQIQLLTSRDLARRAIKSLDLQGNPEFDPLAKGMGALTRALVLIGVVRDPTRMSPEDRILEAFTEKLAVLSPTKTRVLSVEFSSRNPDLSARAANVVAETYIEMLQEAKRDNARSAAQSLATLVADLKTRVAEAEGRVEEFRIKSGLLVGANNAIITTQQLGELNNQLSGSRATQADAQAKAKLLREMLRQNRAGEIPDVANNESVRRIFEQRVILRAQFALESRTLLPAHPRIKELTAQLADLDAQWRAAAERTARTLENDARIAGSRVENLARALEEQKKITGAAGAEEVHLRELERGARLLKDQLEAETAKYQEALARERVKASPADARVIQRALAPQFPSFPKKVPVTAFATIAALILSIGAIVSGELLTDRARAIPMRDATLADAESLSVNAAPAPAISETPVISVAPREDESVAVASAQRAAPTIEEEAVSRIDGARAFATSVKVLVAHCDGPGKGVETIVAMSRALARRGRTLLANADHGDESFDALVYVERGRPKGLADLVAGAAFAEVIHRDAGSRLHVMAGGASDGAERYNLALVVDALAHTYDFVVFATASLEQARQLAPLVDMVFVLGAEGAADALRDELSRAGADAFLLEEGAGADDLAAA
jgi:uncharacterized protein involved in exopolysaccharide biosynthesis